MFLSKHDDGTSTIFVGFTHAELHAAVKGSAVIASLNCFGFEHSAIILIVENERPNPPNDRVNMDAAVLHAKEACGAMTILGLSLEEDDTLQFFSGMELLVDNSEAFPGTTFRVFTESDDEALRVKAMEFGFSNELTSIHESIICQPVFI